jgi:hypothetical protein
LQPLVPQQAAIGDFFSSNGKGSLSENVPDAVWIVAQQHSADVVARNALVLGLSEASYCPIHKKLTRSASAPGI